jgi:hypothetical protein
MLFAKTGEGRKKKGQRESSVEKGLGRRFDDCR